MRCCAHKLCLPPLTLCVTGSLRDLWLISPPVFPSIPTLSAVVEGASSHCLAKLMPACHGSNAPMCAMCKAPTCAMRPARLVPQRGLKGWQLHCMRTSGAASGEPARHTRSAQCTCYGAAPPAGNTPLSRARHPPGRSSARRQDVAQKQPAPHVMTWVPAACIPCVVQTGLSERAPNRHGAPLAVHRPCWAE